jgi:ATP-dependent exoDNAse (exonuclease V) beta subunit
VRSFGKDLDLPLNFEVTLDSDEIVDEALSNTFQKVGKSLDFDLSAVMKNFALNKVEENQHWNIASDLKKFSKSALFSEEIFEILDRMRMSDYSPAFFLQEYEHIKNFSDGFCDSFNEKARDALFLIKSHGLTEKDFNRGSIYNFFKRIAETRKIDLNIKDTLQQQYEARYFGRANEKRQVIRDISEEMAKILDEIFELNEKLGETALLAQEMMKTFFQLASITTIQSELDIVNLTKKQVLVSDFNKKINNIILNEPVPYIYERIGERYKHILTDEFQDTSKMQWINLIPLISNALQSDMTCMLVGDVKQSIYRFRGGNPSLMVDLPELPAVELVKAEHEEVFKQNFLPYRLDTNRRSYENIIQFNNELFTAIVQDNKKVYPEIERYYADVVQNSFKKNRGHVEIKMFNEKVLKSEQRNYKEETLEFIVNTIAEMREKYKYDFKDIAVLVGKNKEGSVIANELLSKNIPVISNESLLLASSEVVVLIINFFKILSEPKSPTTKFRIADFLIRTFHPERRYAGINYKALSKACNENTNRGFILLMNEITGKELTVRKLSYQTLYEVAEEIVMTYGLQSIKGEQIYLQKFFDVLTEQGRKRSQSISEFLEYWEVKKASLAVSAPPAADAVRIMTIHKSKGLEFRVVILPFADWNLQDSRDFWFEMPFNPLSDNLKTIIVKNSKCHPLKNSKFLAEKFAEEDKNSFIDNLNKLYVALTRAEERMYIVCQDRKPDEDTISFASTGKELRCSDFFKAFLRVKEIKGEEEQFVIFNDETINVHAKEKPENFFDLDFITTNHREKIKIKKNSVKPFEDETNLQNITDKFKINSLTLIALSKLNYFSDLPRRAEQMLNEGLLAEEESFLLIQKIQHLLTKPAISPLFEKKEGRKIMLEKEIVGKNISETFVVSRLVFDEKIVHVIDFSKSKYTKENESKLKKVVRALKQMQYEVGKVFFICLEENEVIEI